MQSFIRKRWAKGFRARAVAVAFATIAGGLASTTAQPRETFTAVAIGTGGPQSGATATRLTLNIERWTSPDDSRRLVAALKDSPEKMLSTLNDLPDVGTISTPGSIGYPLRYAIQQRQPDGSRQITLATDRPLSFAEAWIQPQTAKYPFTFVQLRLDAQGRGTGSLTPAARVIPAGDFIVLENWSTAPIALTDVKRQGS